MKGIILVFAFALPAFADPITVTLLDQTTEVYAFAQDNFRPYCLETGSGRNATCIVGASYATAVIGQPYVPGAW